MHYVGLSTIFTLAREGFPHLLKIVRIDAKSNTRRGRKMKEEEVKEEEKEG